MKPIDKNDAATPAASPITNNQTPTDTPKKRGGARPGAGRKPSVDKAAIAQAKADVRAEIDKRTQVAIADAVAKVQAEGDGILSEVPLVIIVQKGRRRIGEKFPEILDSLFVLMEGGKQIVQKYEAAALVLVDTYTEPDDKGRQNKVKIQAFPDRAPDELVLTGETITTHPPDSAVAQFLFNRLAGRPSEEKVNPLDESSEAKPVVSREEMFMDFMDMLFSRMEPYRRPAPSPQIELVESP